MNNVEDKSSLDVQHESGDKSLASGHAVSPRLSSKDLILFILSQVLLAFIFLLINGGAVGWYSKITFPDIQKAYHYATLTAIVIVSLLAIFINLYWAKWLGIRTVGKGLKTILYGLLIIGIAVALFFLFSFIFVVLALLRG